MGFGNFLNGILLDIFFFWDYFCYMEDKVKINIEK